MQCHVAHVTLESNLINKLRYSCLGFRFLGAVSKTLYLHVYFDANQE